MTSNKFESLIGPLPPRWAGEKSAVASALAAAVKAQVIDQNFSDFCHDESGAGDYLPDFVVKAANTEEVAAVVKIANQHAVPLVARGGGSGKSGGCLAVAGGIVLSLADFNRIKEVRLEDDLMIVEPGVTTGAVQKTAEAEGRFYPPDPGALAWCTIGGNVAENAGGPRACKYGVTRDYVLGLEAVTGAGDIIRVGRRSKKGVVGYDLTSLLCGSEGTLAVITEITLQLVANPSQVVAAFLTYVDLSKALEATQRIAAAGFRPRVLELFDRTALAAFRSVLPRLPSGGAALLVELDGATALDAELERMAGVAGGDAVLAPDSRAQNELWQARRHLSETLRKTAKHKLSEDICVPRGALAKMCDVLQGIADQHCLRHAAYGHAGDGNLHVNFFWDDEVQWPAVDAALKDTFKAALALGGTLSGEHGVGLLKREFLTWEQAPKVVSIERQLKAVFDPGAVLNPYKMFPSERQAELSKAFST